MNDLAINYLYIKNYVIEKGFRDEIIWQSSVSFNDLNESSFLREIAWVILSSGMRERIIRNIFGDISMCFFNWESSKKIVENKNRCFNKSIKYFNNEQKIFAIINAAKKLNAIDFINFKKDLNSDPLTMLREFNYIGPITVYHLAKNIGLQYAKPDRHLIRISAIAGYSDVQSFCRDISEQVGDSISVVDLILWRYATLERNYCDIFKHNRL